MTPLESILLVGVVFLVVLLSGHPLAFTLGGMAVLAGATVWGNPGAMNLFIRSTIGVGTNIVYTSIPLFIFMGAMLERSGAADDLFDSMYIIFGPLRGGIAITTVVICTLLAAASGIIGASITLMTILALPAMAKCRYDMKLATGTIMAAGCLGTLIPPSIILVIYGAQAQISIGKLFAGGIGAGLLLSVLYLIYIIWKIVVRPESAPAIDPAEAAKYSQAHKWIMFFKSVLPTSILILLVALEVPDQLFQLAHARLRRVHGPAQGLVLVLQAPDQLHRLIDPGFQEADLLQADHAGAAVRLARAFSTRAVKAAGSSMARLDRALRFRRTSARDRPRVKAE